MQNKENEKHTIPVCFCCGKDYVEHLIVAVTSVLENNRNYWFVFYIFSGNFGPEEKALLEQIRQQYGNCTFVVCQIPVEKFNRFKITDKTRLDLSLATYYRYIAAELIQDYDKLLYLDCDLVVNGDLLPLYQTDLEDYWFAGVPERILYENGYVGKNLKFTEKDVYINAGVLLMNLKAMRQHHFFQQFIEKGLPLFSHIKYCDQDILNILARGKIKTLDYIYNMTLYYVRIFPIRKYQAVIVHYVGKSKPWNLENLDSDLDFLYFKYWNKSILQKQNKVKNFCIYHKPSYLFETDLITPIQTGTYGIHTEMDMLQAASGDTIDYKNKHYGEITAWYWVYKNYLPQHPNLEYVGFCHYRRMLDYENAAPKEESFLVANYISNFVAQHNESYGAQKVYDVIKGYDVVLPKKNVLENNQTNEEQYLQWHPKKDLELLKQIIREDYPDYVAEMEEFLNASTGYYCLLFTMKKEHFVSLTEFTLDILSKLEKRSDWSEYNSYYTMRIPAFLIERFFNVWLMHNQRKYGWKILERAAYVLETPKIKFQDYSFFKLYWRYNKVRFLSKITFRGKRKRYLAEKKALKKYLHKLKEVSKQISLDE